MGPAGRIALIWDAATLDRCPTDPEAVVPGATMPCQGGIDAERVGGYRLAARTL